MSTQLPSPAEIAKHYNDLLRELDGEYIHSRWGDSEIKRRHYRQTELALAHALAAVARVGRVLEIGCGPAVWTPLFLAAAEDVTLFDISQEMLSAARRRVELLDGGCHAAKVNYQCGDFVESTLPGARFDTIVSARAFEYMSDKYAFVGKCFAALRPGGILVLATKNQAWRDLQHTARRLRGVPKEEIPVGQAMQLDLASWEEVRGMFDRAGFASAGAYPVVFGSYMRPFTLPGGLAVADALHRHYYRRPMTRAVNSLVESFVVVGRKPE